MNVQLIVVGVIVENGGDTDCDWNECGSCGMNATCWNYHCQCEELPLW